MASPGRLGNILIREANIDDVKAVHALWNLVFPGHHYQLAGNILAPQDCINLVAHDGGNIVGYITLLKHSTELEGREDWRKFPAYIAGMCVHPDSRSRGVGSQMLGVMILLVLQRLSEYDHMYLHVHADNPEGVKFWQSHGFSHMYTHTNSKGTVSLAMRKPIGPAAAIAAIQASSVPMP